MCGLYNYGVMLLNLGQLSTDIVTEMWYCQLDSLLFSHAKIVVRI